MGATALVLVLAGCHGPELELVPDQVSQSDVAGTEFRVQGVPLAALWVSRGGTLEQRGAPDVWVGEQPAEVVSVDRAGIRVRLREGLPLGVHTLRVSADSEYLRTRALTVMDERTFDAGADAARSDGGPLDADHRDATTTEGGLADAGPSDAGSWDAGSWDAGSPDAGSWDAGAPDASRDAGVDEPEGACTGGSVGARCECRMGDVCTMTCEDNCVVICQPRSTCSVRLRDDGQLHCLPDATCKLEADQRTEVICERGSSCQSSFQHDGTVSCARDVELMSCCIIDCIDGCSGAGTCE